MDMMETIEAGESETTEFKTHSQSGGMLLSRSLHSRIRKGGQFSLALGITVRSLDLISEIKRSKIWQPDQAKY